MWALLRRCVVLLLWVALIGGSNDQLRVMADAAAASYQDCDIAGAASHHNHNPADNDKALCCNYFLCHASASSTMPDPNCVALVVYGTPIHYTSQSAFRPGRVLSPEPKPPRPSALV